MLLLIRRYKKFDGQLIWFYVLFYAVLRFVIESIRGDAVRRLYFGDAASAS